MATLCLTTDATAWIKRLANLLDARVSWRLAPLMAGLLFATGRRTVSSWLRAGGLSDDYQDYYYFLGSLGDKVKSLAAVVLRIAVETIVPQGSQGRILLAIDDTPSKRYGPKVEGAGIHHNPTPGPAGAEFLYGHVWVTLAWVVRHPVWGTIGLPLLAFLYVRCKDIEAQHLTFLRQVTFRTKLAMAGDLVAWAAKCLSFAGRTLWVVADGAYAKTCFLQDAAAGQVIVVSRLRKDARSGTCPRWCAGTAWSWSAAQVRQERDQLGQTRGPPARLEDRDVCVVRGRDEQALQDLPGDLPARRRPDPGGFGERGQRRLAGLLLHPYRGQRGGDSRSGGGSLGPGTGVP